VRARAAPARADDGRRVERGGGPKRPGDVAPRPGLAGHGAAGRRPAQARLCGVSREPHRCRHCLRPLRISPARSDTRHPCLTPTLAIVHAC